MSGEFSSSQATPGAAAQKDTPISLFLGVLEEVIAEEQTNISSDQRDTGLEEVQYLHVRNALSVRFGGRPLTSVEKSLVNSRLLQFVPATLTVMQNFLLRNGALEMEGLFRVAPSNKVFAGALAQCEDANASGLPPHFLQENLSTSITIAAQRQQLITTVSSLYKLFLRRLPDPLISREVFDDIALFMPLADRLRASYPKLLAKIAPRCLRCLRHILRFLRTVAKRKETNRMSANNLARIFAPSLLPKGSQQEPDEPTMDFMLLLQRESDWQILSVQMLIEDQDDIFDEVEDILAQKAEEEFLETGTVPSDANGYMGTIFDLELRGKWHFPPPPAAAAEAQRRRKEQRAAKAASKSLRQIGMDFRKVMSQIQVFNAAEHDGGGGGGGGGGAGRGGGGGAKGGEEEGEEEQENRANFAMEFLEWPLPFAISNVASLSDADEADDTAELGMLCITAVRPVPPKAPVKPHWRLEKNDGVRQVNDLDTSKMSAADVQGHIMQLHKLHNVDRITVHFTRSYYPKHQNFNGTCLLEGSLCRKARNKIVKKNWKKRWFRLFAVGDNYSVLVYYKDAQSQKVKGRYYIDSQCRLEDIPHPDRPHVFQVTHSDGSFSVRLDAETAANAALWVATIRDRIDNHSTQFQAS